MLACLVASMTIGAAVLEWSQPASSAQPFTGRQLIAQLKDAIHQPDQDDAAARRWQTIRIEPRNKDSQGGAPDCHFLLRRDGRLEFTENWRAQRQLPEAGVIEIALEVSTGSDQANRVQRQGAEHLVRSLQEMYGIPSRGILPNDALGLPVLAVPSPPPGPLR